MFPLCSEKGPRGGQEAGQPESDAAFSSAVGTVQDRQPIEPASTLHTCLRREVSLQHIFSCKATLAFEDAWPGHGSDRCGHVVQ